MSLLTTGLFLFSHNFLKIIEKLCNVRLDNLIERHSILSNSQYGPNMSTSLSLLELREGITSALDHDHKKVLLVFFL